MKKRIMPVLLILAILAQLFTVLPVSTAAEPAAVWDGSVASDFAGGDGTETNPYLISNGAELALLQAKIANAGQAAEYFDKSYKLTADIVLNEGDAATWADSFTGHAFTPIGVWNNTISSFGGHFDGDGHTISGLYITNTYESGVGGIDGGIALFGCIQGGARIENLALVNAYIESTNTGGVGAIVGQTDRSSEEDVTISNVYSDAILVGAGTECGGIIGNLSNSKSDGSFISGRVRVDRATFAGSVYGTNYVGGIIGNARNVGVTITNCLVYASIRSSGSYVAGIMAKSKSDEGKTPTGANIPLVSGCIVAGTEIVSTASKKYNCAYVSQNSGTAAYKTEVEFCFDAVRITDTRNANDDNCEDIAANKLYGFYAGEDPIDWEDWGGANWATKSRDILRPAGIAEQFDIAPFVIGSLFDGASVRLMEPTGLRFTASIAKEDLAVFASVTGYGIVIAPTQYVQAAGEFTMDALEGISVAEGSKYLKIEAEKLVDETDDEVIFTGVIGNIRTQNYNVDFSAIVYVEADGQVYYSAYNTAANSRSIRTVATAALADLNNTQTEEYPYAVDDQFSPYTAEQRAVLTAFLG